jgi:hypothetical protein
VFREVNAFLVKLVLDKLILNTLRLFNIDCALFEGIEAVWKPWVKLCFLANFISRLGSEDSKEKLCMHNDWENRIMDLWFK